MGKRRALLVGINRYAPEHTPERPAHSRPQRIVSNLAGSVDDARDMRDMLITSYGFPPDDVKMLLDQEAKRDAILAAFREHLIDAAGEGDDVVFFYAGHGSQVANSLSSEPDKMDETLVPADAAYGRPDIRDKELRRLCNEALDRGARLTVILDCCHSGSGARGLLPPAIQARAAAPDPRDVADASEHGPPPETRGALILSAAQDHQSAWEAPDASGRCRGAFSVALLQALRMAGEDEPAEHVYLRAKARMQTAQALQEPVLAGSAERREQPLLGSRTDRRDGKAVVAVQRVEPDGKIVLQGGWTAGLSAGSELERRASREDETAVRVQVTEVQGPARSEARLVEGFEGRREGAVASGDLFELAAWSVDSEPSLRVWIPEAGEEWESLTRFARTLKDRAAAAGASWIADPTHTAPRHVLSWTGGGWTLAGPDGLERLGPAPSPEAVLDRLTAGDGLFVHLPVPAGLSSKIRLGEKTDHNAVLRTVGPAGADYVLAGRLGEAGVEIAWVRPAASVEGKTVSVLPSRTDWHPLPTAASDLAATLEEKALRLAKIRSWLTLESPPGNGFPYRLALRPAYGGKALSSGQLRKGTAWGLLLRARPEDLAGPPQCRYVYIFSLDSFGRSSLLHPALSQGSVENRLPFQPPPGVPFPTEIPVGTAFEIDDPLGVDTYFLLTTAEAVPSPWVLHFDGVRARGLEEGTPLEKLLSQRGSAHRGTKILTPASWSLERLTFESVPGP